MRRYSVLEAPRAVLLSDLDERIVHEEHVERLDRAEAFRTARAEVAGGAKEARGGHTLFRVSVMRAESYGIVEGTYDEVVAMLEESGAERAKQGSEDKARAFARALNSIQARIGEARVEDIVYRVVEG